MNITNHPLLNTIEVGKSKPSKRILPKNDHVYGYKPPP